MIAEVLLAWAMGPKTAPSIACPGPSSATVATVSEDSLGALIPQWAPDAKQSPTATQAKDDITFPVPAKDAVWFPGSAGGAGNGANLAYDGIHFVLYSCAHHDLATELAVWSIQPPVPKPILQIGINGGFHTSKGLTIGATPTDVQAIYGNAPLQTYNGDLKALLYQQGSAHVFTTFVFRNGSLVGIRRVLEP